MNEQAKPTPGPWTSEVTINDHGGWKSPEQQVVIYNDAGVIVAYYATVFDDYPSDSENEANAALIAEAGTVYHETGLTPRQLAEQRKELMEELDYAIYVFHEIDDTDDGPNTAIKHRWGVSRARHMITRLNGVLAHARGEKQP